jgi:acyl-CoA thioester hydrolase
MRFNHSLIVSNDDIDELGHVNNVVYVRYVQEAANAHWNAIVTEEIKKQSAWVVMRHEIDYLRPAFAGDQLMATTWVGETNGARSIRFVELTHKPSGQLIAKAKTIWCQLDAITFRPKRVEEHVINLLKGIQQRGE